MYWNIYFLRFIFKNMFFVNQNKRFYCDNIRLSIGYIKHPFLAKKRIIYDVL